MRRFRRYIRYLTTFVLSTLTVGIAIGVFGEFFIEWAKEEGWYKNPSERVASIVATFQMFTNTWFFALAFGTVLGGSLFMWADHFIRWWQARRKDKITPEQITDLLDSIAQTRKVLEKSPTGATHEGYHEVVAVCFKLKKFDIKVPIEPPVDDLMELETFGSDFLKYLSAVTPYIRSGDLALTRHFAGNAINMVYVSPPSNRAVQRHTLLPFARRGFSADHWQ